MLQCSLEAVNSAILLLAIDCGNLPTPRNGSIHGEHTTYSNTLRFICDDGFTLVGSTIRKCGANGTWSGVGTVCKGNKN